jgi:hypothetical protein
VAPQDPHAEQHLLFVDHVFAQQTEQVDEIAGDDAAWPGHVREPAKDVSEQLALLDVLAGELRREVFSPRADPAQRRRQVDVFPLDVHQKRVEKTDCFASERTEVAFTPGEDAIGQTLQSPHRSPQGDVVGEDPLPGFIDLHAFSQSGFGKCNERAEAVRRKEYSSIETGSPGVLPG